MPSNVFLDVRCNRLDIPMRTTPRIYMTTSSRRVLRNPPLARRSMTKCHVSGRRANHLPVFQHSPKPTRLPIGVPNRP